MCEDIFDKDDYVVIKNKEEAQQFVAKKRKDYKEFVHYASDVLTKKDFPFLLHTSIEYPRGCGSDKMHYNIFDSSDLKNLAKALRYKISKYGEKL